MPNDLTCCQILKQWLKTQNQYTSVPTCRRCFLMFRQCPLASRLRSLSFWHFAYLFRPSRSWRLHQRRWHSYRRCTLSSWALLPCFAMLCSFCSLYFRISHEEFSQSRLSMCFDYSTRAHKGDLCRRVLTQVLVM